VKVLQTHPFSGPTDWSVRGLPLPAALISLLQSHRWTHPGQQALRNLMPWFEDPLMFMADLRDMRFQNNAPDSIVSDRSTREVFRMARGSHSERPIELPWLDADQAVLVAVNERAGDDVALALDYRTDIADPRVVASDIWTDPTRYSWRVVTPTFTDLVAALRPAWSSPHLDTR
jgi:hypothetical protein